MSVDLDGDLTTADWLRTSTWDLPTHPDLFLLTLTELGFGATESEALAHFQTLPAARAMPDDLREALKADHPNIYLDRHYGPGPHKSGSDQDVHGEPGDGGDDPKGPDGPLPVPDDEKSYPGGYNPNATFGELTELDKLYWVAASRERLRAIRDNATTDGTLGFKLLLEMMLGERPTDLPIYRGVRMVAEGDADAGYAIEQFQPGAEIDLKLTSFSTSRAEALLYARGDNGRNWSPFDDNGEVKTGPDTVLNAFEGTPGHRSVLIEVLPGAATAKIGKTFGGTTIDERISAGRYRVVDATVRHVRVDGDEWDGPFNFEGGITVVTLEQVAVLDPTGGRLWEAKDWADFNRTFDTIRLEAVRYDPVLDEATLDRGYEPIGMKDAAAWARRHYGPGPHKSGSDQDVHGKPGDGDDEISSVPDAKAFSDPAIRAAYLAEREALAGRTTERLVVAGNGSWVEPPLAFKIVGKDGSEDRAEPSREQIALMTWGGVVLHNHPNKDSLPFSPEDLSIPYLVSLAGGWDVAAAPWAPAAMELLTADGKVHRVLPGTIDTSDYGSDGYPFEARPEHNGKAGWPSRRQVQAAFFSAGKALRATVKGKLTKAKALELAGDVPRLALEELVRRGLIRYEVYRP